MKVITSILGTLPDMPEVADVDPVELTSEERAGAHLVAETAAGRVVRISLPRGVELQDADVLMLEGNTAVVVKAREESLLLLVPGSDQIAWWAACYQLGNLHRQARFRQDGVLTPEDPLIMQMLLSLGVGFKRVLAPFVGQRFGATGAHHHHGEVSASAAEGRGDHHDGH